MFSALSPEGESHCVSRRCQHVAPWLRFGLGLIQCVSLDYVFGRLEGRTGYITLDS